jgi:hypothetical protein
MKIPRDHPHLVDRLVTGARPVSRLHTPAVRALAWMALPAALLAWVAVAHLRTDLADRLRTPAFALELGLLAAGAGLSTWLAFRAAAPDRRPSGGALGLAVSLVAVACVALLWEPVRPLRAGGGFGAVGVGCLAKTVALAALPWVLLVAALWRGAPVTPATGGALAGAAAFLLANVAMRVVCPNDIPLHVLTWHLLPVGAAGVLSAALGAAWFGRWALSARPSHRLRSRQVRTRGGGQAPG